LSSQLLERWRDLAELLGEHRDVIDERPWDEPTQALVTRRWSTALLGFSDVELDALEIDGAASRWPASTPPSLRSLAERVETIANGIPRFVSPASGRLGRRAEKPRKRVQVDAFAHALEPLLPTARRVVDVGSGHGHLTRAIAERIDRPVIGLERDEKLLGRAAALPSTRAPAFARTDVLAEGLAFEPGDCVVALHACGELGDAIVSAAAETGASVALVGCCLQKQRTPARASLCAPSDAALLLPKALLGLSNLTPRDLGVEATRAENLAARERRLALHELLSAIEPTLAIGAEIDGLNRRAAHGDLEALVQRAFALRGLGPPPRSAIDAAAGSARARHARARRLSLPRNLFSRVIELFVLFDRARFLEERGFVVRIGSLFPPEVSARNLALFSSPTAS
jgi:SAM-dependent methyltransferase